MLFVGTSIIHPSTEGVFLLCNILDLLIYRKEFKYVVTDPEGIHARPAGMLVKAVKEFSCDIKIAKDGKAMNCKAIFGIMGLAVKQGEEVTLTFDGADEDAAYEAISNFMKENL